jgi:pectate lyase
MRSKFLVSIVLLIAAACTAQKNVQMQSVSAPLAFPGAEGYGRFTTGGRGGIIIIVTNLNDRGEGSLRDAVNVKGARTIVFAVAGTIHLESILQIKNGDLTIAGQTAPGDGICIADFPVTFRCHNLIVRFIRFRMGDKNQKGGMIDGNGGDDAFGGTHCRNVIIDHCSMSWSTDEVFSVYGGDSTTLQWNLIAEPLNYSYHFEKGDSGYEHHGFGAIWGGFHSSFHHNLFVHCGNRTPRFDGIRNIPSENCDYRNNVIYDWSSNNIYAGEGGNYNIVNNYFKYGPSTSEKVKSRIVNPYKRADISFGKFFLSGNYVDGYPDVTANNSKGVAMNEGNADDKRLALLTSALPYEPVITQNAQEAYESVLLQAGVTVPARDTLDQRFINDVRNRTGRMIDVQGGFPHGTAYEMTVNAWPTLRPGIPSSDSDGDSMPDEWEKKNGLDPQNAQDASAYKLDKNYTNIELYINSLVKQ